MADALSMLRELLAHFWPVLVCSFLVTLIATPICRRIALAGNVVDHPDSFLKPHKKPIPYLGGVAVFAGWTAGLALAAIYLRVESERTFGIIMGGWVIMLIGLFDDLRVMGPKPKLIGNVIVALWIIWLGVGDDLAAVLRPFGVEFSQDEGWLRFLYSWPLAIFIIVGACNATNVIDGLDGLCSGVLGIISLGFLILSCHLTYFYPTDPDNPLRLVLCLAILGAACGFLPFNTNPAKIFLGDAGSMLLGLNAAILILMVFESNKLRWVIGALMVFGLPIGDMILALIRRWRNGRPLMEGDRSHFYDQLIDRGLSVRQVVAISYGVTLIFVGAGCLVIFLRGRQAAPAYVLFILFWAVVVSRTGMIGVEKKQRPPPDERSGLLPSSGGD